MPKYVKQVVVQMMFDLEEWRSEEMSTFMDVMVDLVRATANPRGVSVIFTGYRGDLAWLNRKWEGYASLDAIKD